MLRELALPLAVCFVIALVGSLIATAFYLADFRGDCQDGGGRFVLDGATAWCRH